MELLLRETTSPVHFLFNLNLITGITNTFTNTCNPWCHLILIKISQNCESKFFWKKFTSLEMDFFFGSLANDLLVLRGINKRRRDVLVHEEQEGEAESQSHGPKHCPHWQIVNGHQFKDIQAQFTWDKTGFHYKDRGKKSSEYKIIISLHMYQPQCKILLIIKRKQINYLNIYMQNKLFNQ